MNAFPSSGLIPVVYIWWPHTIELKTTIVHIQIAVTLAPKAGFREKTDNRSETIPQAGRISIYTSGCPKIQNTC
tara:strand:+ start:8531 stop:8752 length:222 start_codon:yes stop_codon:yes gene_type:complete